MKQMILFEDEYIIVLEKPAGTPVQSARIGTKDLVSMLKNYRKETEAIKGEPYIGVIHRLDQPVQGIVIFAKTKAAAADLSAQAANGTMEKYYLAVVCGQPKESQAQLTDYLLKDGKTNTSKIVAASLKGAKKAELTYKVIKKTQEKALLEIKLITGRHHQIRVQLSGAGLPLENDQKYNPGAALSRVPVALAAYKISFRHPRTKEQISLEIQPKGTSFDNFR